MNTLNNAIMNTEIKIFNNPIFGEIRATEIEGKTYFVGSDVAKALVPYSSN